MAIVGTGFAAFGSTVALIQNDSIEIEVFDVGKTRKIPNTKDMPVPNGKSCDGSHYPYGINDDRWSVKVNSQRICSSHAMGGYSVVYSGAMLYPKNNDLSEWPEESRPLAIDYDAVLSLFNVLSAHDELTKEFPIIPSQQDLENTQRGERVALLGLSRVAITKETKTAGHKKTIFCTKEFFNNLAQQKRIKYRSEVYVLKVERSGEKLQIHLKNEKGIQEKIGDFDGVFLGAGCVNSTGIVDRSLFGVGTRDYQLKSPVGFINAFCRLGFYMGKDQRIRREAKYPEFFLEIKSASTFQTWSHTQITAINEQIISAASSKIPFFGFALEKIFKSFMYFALTVVHSRFGKATPVKVTTRKSHEGLFEYSICIEEKNQSVDIPRVSKDLFQAVRKNWEKLRMVPLPFGGQLAEFFRGNKLGGWHYGGTLPMKQFPKAGQCHPDGAVAGLEGLYVVDSAAFPEIPGSTVALLICANSHRVARQWKNKAQPKAKDTPCQ